MRNNEEFMVKYLGGHNKFRDQLVEILNHEEDEMPVSTTLEPVMSDPCKMPVSTTLEPVMSNPCEVLDSLLSSSDSVTTDSCQSDEVITDFEVQTILHNDDSDGLVYYLSFSEFKFSNTDILDWALNRRAYKCISVLLSLKVDLSNTLNAADELPLTVVAESLNPRLVEAFIRHGAKTSTLRTSGYKTFVLEEALDSFCWNLEDQWNPEQSIFKLIIILCLPRMKHSLETIRLLVQSTKEASDIIYSSAMGGELIVLAILLMVAKEKVMEYKIPVLGYDGSGIDGETKKHLDSETIRSVVVKNKLHKMICQDRQHVEMFRMYKQVKKSAISLFLVFEKAGDAIERYLKLQQPNVPEEQVIKEVALLLVDAGFNVKPEHTDLSEIYRCVIVETDKLLEKETGQQFRMERGRYEYSQMHIKFGVTSYGWKRWVFPKINPHGYPDLSSLPLPFFLNCKVMVPTASGLRRMMDMAVTIMDKQQLLPDFLPLKELVPVAPLIKKGLRILRRKGN